MIDASMTERASRPDAAISQHRSPGASWHHEGDRDYRVAEAAGATAWRVDLAICLPRNRWPFEQQRRSRPTRPNEPDLTSTGLLSQPWDVILDRFAGFAAAKA